MDKCLAFFVAGQIKISGRGDSQAEFKGHSGLLLTQRQYQSGVNTHQVLLAKAVILRNSSQMPGFCCNSLAHSRVSSCLSTSTDSVDKGKNYNFRKHLIV